MAPNVELLPLPPGDTVHSLIPLNYILAKMDEIGTGNVDKGKSAICCEVEILEEQINTAKHLVAVNRTRCILKEVNSEVRSFCWFFGEYSNSMVKLGVREKDMVMICCPTVVRTKLKPKQVMTPNMSTWTIHCIERDPEPSITFFRQEEQEPSKEIDVTSTLVEQEGNTQVQEEILLDQSQLVDVLHNSQNRSQQQAKTPLQVRRAPPPPSPILMKAPTSRPFYTSLSACTIHKKRYKVFAVLSDVVETPRRRKSKIVTKLTIQDESLYSCGDLRDHFRFDILADSMEQVPVLEVGSILRIHNMVVEVFNGLPDGRVYSGQCVTVVEGGVGDTITPTTTRKMEDLDWGEEDERRVIELRKWLMERMVMDNRRVRTIEEIVGVCETDLSCKMVTVSRVPEGLVVRVEDGTCSQVLSVEYRGQDTMTQEEAGNNKHFLDVWVENSVQVDRIRELDLVAGDWMRMKKVKCVKEGEEGEPPVFRFVVEEGKILRLGEGDMEVASMRERMGEVGESQTDSYVDRILTAVNMEGSFSFLDSQEESGVGIGITLPLPPTTVSMKGKEGLVEDVECEAVGAECPVEQLQDSPVGMSGEDPHLSASKSSVSVNAICPPVSVASVDMSSPVSLSDATSTPLIISVSQPVSPALPEISLPSPDSEISFPLLEKSLTTTQNNANSSLSPTPPSLPPGQCPPSILQIPEVMCSQMSQFDCEGSPLRHHPDSQSPLARSDSTPSQMYFTPPGSPCQEEDRPARSIRNSKRGKMARKMLEVSKDSSTDTGEDVDNSSFTLKDSEIVNSNSEEVSNTDFGQEVTSSPSFMRKEMVRTVYPTGSLACYRSCLMVVCHSMTRLARVDCTIISSVKPGRYRLQGVISQVEQEEGDKLQLVRGLCQECGKLDKLEMFDQRGVDIFCCKRGRVTLCAKKILQVVMYVADQTSKVGEEVKLVVSGKEAELFLGCSAKQFIVESEIRDIVENKVMKLKGVVGDFGVEKCDLGNLWVVESRIRG